jgi:replicative DNA helicase
MTERQAQMDDLLIPPSSIESEQAVIGGLLLEPYRIDGLLCSPADFYSHDHRMIFEAMTEMADKGQQIDVVTVAERLEGKRQLADVGGIVYLGQLAQNAPGAANIRRYSEIIKEKALIRELMQVSSSIASRCANAMEPASELVAEAEAEIYAIMDKRETAEPVHIHTAVEEAIDHIGEVVDGLTYQPTGLDDLDHFIGGLRGGATYVIAARSSMGKTALMCSIAHRVAKDKP